MGAVIDPDSVQAVDDGGDQWVDRRASSVDWAELAGLDPGWWFLRKPPGFRLRFRKGHAAASRWPTRGAYEPEVHRFGGPVGMAVAHDHFEADSMAAAAWEVAGRPGSALAISLWHLGSLAAELCEDGAELAEVWAQLEAAISGPTSVALDPAVARAVLGLTDDPELALAHLPPTDLRERWDAAAKHAAHLRGTDVPVRRWLIAAAPFHWNRLGMDRHGVRACIEVMQAVL